MASTCCSKLSVMSVKESLKNRLEGIPQIQMGIRVFQFVISITKRKVIRSFFCPGAIL